MSNVLVSMRHLAAITLLALATTGCIGSSASSTTGPSSDSNPAVPWSKTVLTITYYAHQCPPGARCPGHIKSRFGGSTFVRVTRQLACDPAGDGAARDYTDPTAACNALREIVAKLKTKDWVCGCATGSHPTEKGSASTRVSAARSH